MNSADAVERTAAVARFSHCSTQLGTYLLALAELDTSDDRGFHHYFVEVRSLSKTKIELTVRKNEKADIDGML